MNNAAAAKGPATEVVDTLNGGVAGFQSAVGGMGGLSALHHAVRQGNVNAVLALLDGGANINDTSNVDRTTPLLHGDDQRPVRRRDEAHRARRQSEYRQHGAA